MSSRAKRGISAVREAEIRRLRLGMTLRDDRNDVLHGYDGCHLAAGAARAAEPARHRGPTMQPAPRSTEDCSTLLVRSIAPLAWVLACAIGGCGGGGSDNIFSSAQAQPTALDVEAAKAANT